MGLYQETKFWHVYYLITITPAHTEIPYLVELDFMKITDTMSLDLPTFPVTSPKEELQEYIIYSYIIQYFFF